MTQDDNKRASELLTTSPGPSYVQQSRSVSASAAPVAPTPVLDIKIPVPTYEPPETPVSIVRDALEYRKAGIHKHSLNSRSTPICGIRRP